LALRELHASPIGEKVDAIGEGTACRWEQDKQMSELLPARSAPQSLSMEK
jgi:hypothetical protein